MKYLLKALASFICLSTICSCDKKVNCNLSYRLGERVDIPIQFEGFDYNEMNSMRIYIIKDNNADTFEISEFLLHGEMNDGVLHITDQPHSLSTSYGYYESYLDNSDMVFFWNTGSDTLKSLSIKKSKENIKGCHENDANVKIDKLNFIYNDKVYSKNDLVIIEK